MTFAVYVIPGEFRFLVNRARHTARGVFVVPQEMHPRSKVVGETLQTMSFNPLDSVPVSNLTLGAGADDIIGQDSWLFWVLAGLL